MSRICVKNIGKNTSDKQLRELFSSKGEVTDVKVITTKDGQSRRFAFVGFRTEVQATEAQKHFNNTFIGLSKISVEMAKKFNDQALKESKQKIADKKAKPTKQVKNDINEHNEEEERKSHGNKADSLVEVDTTSVAGRKKAEFLEMMKSRKNSNKWANDDVAGTGTSLEADQMPAQRSSTRALDTEGTSDSDSDAESDEESVNSMVVDGEGAEGSADREKQPVSDLDYLRSKITRKRTDSDFSSSSEGESDSEGEEQGEGGSGRAQTASKQAAKPTDPVEEPMDEEGVVVVNGSVPEFGEEEDEDTARLFVKNLPFSCTEEEFRALFSPFGPLSEVHLPLDEEKRGKGYGFVQYMLPEHAQSALESLSSEAFQGRVLFVVKAQRPKEKEVSAVAPGKGNVAKLSSFQLKKEEERRKAMNRKEGWNAAFVRSDAVVDSLASRHGMSSADILDTTRSGGEMAVRLAIGESQIVMENRDYFAQHGVDIEALESTHSTQKATTRSTTTLLVKNLPPSSVPDELESMFARFGSIAAFLAPPSKTMVVVDFVEPSEARAAQKGLAYRNYKHTPLYLEWAPVNAIDRKKAAQAAAASANSKNSKKTTAAASSSGADGKHGKGAEEEDDQQQYSSLFIKNLNFSTSEMNLRDHLLQLGVEGLRTVLIQKKQIGKNMLSQGYGFAEFKSPDHATKALAKMKGSLLDSHALEVKPSDKRLTTAPAAAARSLLASSASGGAAGAGSGNNKLIVRNVAFQASKAEIRDLFSAFGSVKRVRIPKKMGGEHRGFAFVDFSTGQEAALAMASLRNTHLYGRHLVLEWAKEEDDQEGEVTGMEGFAALGGGRNKVGLHSSSGGGGSRSAETAGTALDRLRKKARQDERVIAMTNSNKRARVQDILDTSTGGVGSDDV